MRTQRQLAIALLALLVFSPGCGGGSGDDSETQAKRGAVQRAALAARLDRLQAELQRRRAQLRAKHKREAQRVARERQSQASGPSTAAANSSFKALASELDGEIGAVIGPPGSSEAASFGSLQSGSAWSTSKVPIVLRVLANAGGPTGLSSSQTEQIRSALTLSDNGAAAALFGDLERGHGGLGGASAAVDEVLSEGGDSSTQISTQGRGEFSTYGQTEWSLANQQHFMSALAAGCVVGPESSGYVLDLMGEVSSDTWGLGSAPLPARWKGGWGPGVDGGYLVRQMGVLYVGEKEAVVTLAALPADGQFASGESMATALAQWLAGQAPKYAAPAPRC
jgi:hypothetical protein